MNIQWFPGHMTKALRMMRDNIKLVDAVGYVLDARAPASCLNPEFDKLIDGKPCLFILNKCDLADPSKTEQWCAYLRKRGYSCVQVTATASAQAAAITNAFRSVTAVIKAKYKSKGIFKPVRCLILGVPNCGKSTIINCLSGRKTVVTGDKPGVTKGKQWVRLANGLELLDTPGTLWPKFDDDSLAANLCFIGSVKDDVVDICELACLLIGRLEALYPGAISLRYSVEEGADVASLFDCIARSKGFIMRGGEIDAERCAKAILDDFRKGRLGKITLDNAPSLN